MNNDQSFSLTHSITRVATADGFDVRLLKIALSRFGYYTSDKDIGLADFADANMFTALKDFQKDKHLTATGAVRPGDDTEQAIDRAIEDQPLSAQYIWRTCGDDKVRDAHAARDGKVFSWINPPKGGNPGSDHNCRCWAEPVKKGYTQEELQTSGIDKITPEYPVEAAVGLIVGGQIGLALRTLNELPRNLNWQDGAGKNYTKWKKQRTDRGWENDAEVTEALRTGKRYRAYNKLNPENPAIRYEYKGKYLVRDEVTNDIIHYGAKSFDRPAVPPKGNKP